MTRDNLFFIVNLLLLFAVTACQQETFYESAKGGFAVTLLDETEATDVWTKASPLQLPASVAREFHLTITKESNGFVLYDGGYTDELIPASAANYTVEASFGENNILEINSPYFVGKEMGVEVEAGDEPTTVNLSCKLENALTSVRFGEEDVNRADFDKLFKPGYGVKIAIGHYSTVLTDSMKVAYYKAGTKPADVSFTFVGTIRGNEEAVEYPLSTDAFPVLGEEASFKAGAHIRLVLALQEMATGLVPTIVYAEVKKETVTETFPMEWLPKPQVEARGDFDEANKILFYETETPTGSIRFNSALGLQDLEFTVAFNDATYSKLNGDYKLSEMSDAQKQAFAEAGIILPILDDTAENDSIGFTKAFITALTYSTDKANDSKEVANVIQLTKVTANDKTLTNEGGELDYTIAIKKAPKFRVSVDERNVWSKSFTADVVQVTNEDEGADAEAVKAGIGYQYSIDGKQWYDCSDSPNRSHQFDTHPADDERAMSVRAIFRGFKSSNKAAIELEVPKQMPNSNMDEWSYISYTSYRQLASNAFTAYTFYPWESGASSENCFWDTNNDFTTRHRWSVASMNTCGYNGFHAVSYVAGRTGLAAEIRSTANGRANTRGLGLHTEKSYNKVAGELYTGTTSVSVGGNDANASGDTYTKTKDSEHPSRPSAISFWYKYVPYKTDECKVQIQLLDENGEVIVETEVKSTVAQNTWAEVRLDLPYATDTYNKYAKCKYIYVAFYSSTKSGDDLPYNDDLDNTHTFYVDANNDKQLADSEKVTFEPAFVGSKLYIDDISLIYDK